MPSKIVVGVDGSDGSRRALRWALEQAATRPAAVEAVMVWQRTFDYGSPGYWPVDVGIAERTRAQLAEAVADAAGPVPDGGVKAEELVLEGDPGRVLCARSVDADLLVLGGRAHGGIADHLVGSVIAKCVHHSRCPVVVVPAAYQEERR